MTTDWDLLIGLFSTGLISSIIFVGSITLLIVFIKWVIEGVRKYYAEHGFLTTIATACGWTLAFVVFIFLMICIGFGVRVLLM